MPFSTNFSGNFTEEVLVIDARALLASFVRLDCETVLEVLLLLEARDFWGLDYKISIFMSFFGSIPLTFSILMLAKGLLQSISTLPPVFFLSDD